MEEENKTEHVITLDVLKQFPNLQEMGALPGDKVVDGELVRVYSDGSLSNPQGGIVVTEEAIGAFSNLQEMGAKPGDKIVDGELVRMEELSNMRQAVLGFEETGNDIGNLVDWMTAKIHPAFGTRLFFQKGNFIGTSEEVYGEGFNEADTETRKEMIMNAKARALLENQGYSQVLDAPDSGARTAGSFAKMLASPTTLLPVGKTVKAGAAIGAGLGAGTVALEQLATGEELDAKKIATVGAVGGILGGSIAKAGSVFRNMKEESLVRGANSIIDKTQAAIDDGVEQGLKGKELRDFVAKTTKISDEDLTKATQIAGRKPRVAPPGSKVSAEAQVDDIIENGGAAARVKYKGLDRLFGSLSTRIRNIDEGTFFRMRKYEFKVHTKTQKILEKVTPFMKRLDDLSNGAKQKAALALFNGNKDDFINIVREEAPNLITEYNTVRKILGDKNSGLMKELKSVGYTFDEIENYFPRVVKDLEGLKESLGRERRGIIQSSLEAVAKARTANGLVSELTQVQKSAVVDQVMRGKRAVLRKGKDGPRIHYQRFEVKEPGIANTKKRTIDTLSEDQLQYYYTPQEALFSYVNRAVNEIEKRNLFGQGNSLVLAADGTINTEASIGAFVNKAKQAGRITDEQELDLQHMLEARFVGGAQTPNTVLQTIRDLGYASTIANPFTAIIQLGDLAASGALKGFKNTLAALFKTKDVDAIELGITQATQEMSLAPTKTGNLLNKLLKGTGFTRLDRLGKDTIINASIRRARGLAKSDKGRAELKKRYGAAFGDEFDSFIDDLQTGKISENIKLFAFNEISDMQPVSLLEMPETYLNNPDGRIFYMLKSFILKQYDVVRRELVQEWGKASTKAEKAAVAKKGAALFGYLAVGNAGTGIIRDVALGREVNPEQLPDRAMWSLLGVYGANKYVGQRYLSQGDVTGAVINTFAPAAPLVDGVTRGAADTIKQEVDEDTLGRIVKAVPGVGSFFYNWFLGGAEKYNESMGR